MKLLDFLCVKVYEPWLGRFLLRYIITVNLYSSCFQVKACISVLCRHGANPNVINAFGDNTMTLLLGSLSRWLYHASDDETRLETLLIFSEETLRLFLAHGLNPQLVLRKNLKQFVIIFNSKIFDRAFIHHLNQLLWIVVCAGGDPNMIQLSELHSTLGGATDPPMYATKYTVGYYLARGLYIHARYENFAAFDILNVFQHTLNQRLLASCMAGVCANLDEEFESGTHNALIQTRLKAMSATPRSLRALSRIAIYVAVKWKLDRHCHKLPLPNTLITYLLNVE